MAWESAPDAVLESVAEMAPEFRIVDPAREAAGRFLVSYASGEVLPPERVLSIPIAWDRVGPFDGAALRSVAGIPYGRTATYGAVAALSGKPGHARAVGGAMSRNPWPIIVPCHRVVGARGAMVGFGKGIPAKEALLLFERENVEPPLLNKEAIRDNRLNEGRAR